VLGRSCLTTIRNGPCFGAEGADRFYPTYEDNWFTGKHVGEDSNRSRVDEASATVIERDMVSEGIEIETRGRDTVNGYGDAEIYDGVRL
jgi:hypothetical protein